MTSTIDTSAVQSLFVRRSGYESVSKVNGDPRNSMIIVPLIRMKFNSLLEPRAPRGFENASYSFNGFIDKPTDESTAEYKEAVKALGRAVRLKYGYIRWKEKALEEGFLDQPAYKQHINKWLNTSRYCPFYDGDGEKGQKIDDETGEILAYDAGHFVFKANNPGRNAPTNVIDANRVKIERNTPDWEAKVVNGNFFSVAINLYTAVAAKDVTGGLGTVQFVAFGSPLGGGTNDGGDILGALPSEDPTSLMSGEDPMTVVDSGADDAGVTTDKPAKAKAKAVAQTSVDLDDEIPF